MFYNQILSKAVQSCLTEPFSTIPSQLKTATPGKGKTFHYSSLNNLISEMRSIIDSSEALSIFDDFFLVTWGLGLKAKFIDSSPEGYKTALTVYNLDWSKIAENSSYLDLGFSFFPSATNDGNRLDGATIRYDPFIFNTNLGGFKYKKQDHDILLMQAYSLSKEDLYQRGSADRHGKDFEPNEIISKSKGLSKFVEERLPLVLEGMKNKSYPARIEYRFLAQNFAHLAPILEAHLINGDFASCTSWQSSHMLWLYADKFMDSIWSLTKYSVNMAGELFVDRKLSLIAVLAFLLSGIFHRPLGKSWWRQVHKIIEEHRRPNSNILFFQDFLALDTNSNSWSITNTFNISTIRAIYHPTLENTQIEITTDIDEQNQQEGLIPSFIYTNRSPGYHIQLDIPDNCKFVNTTDLIYQKSSNRKLISKDP
ncbi:hypothetical protein BD408DRAFT_441848, partial [Parasitella parasitica]